MLDDRLDALNAVSEYLIGAGIARERLLLEGHARTTWENATLLKALLEHRGTVCPCGLLLVISTWHLPRSIGVFQRAGFSPDDCRLFAYPVDFRTRNGRRLWLSVRRLDEGLRLMDLAVKEWIGLVVYWLTGRTSVLWPGPQT